MNAWSHLPNAAHIDDILADVKVRPGVWADARREDRESARAEAWTASRRGDVGTAEAEVLSVAWGAKWVTWWGKEWEAVQGAAWAAAQGAAGNSARDALRALVFWPESASLLDRKPDELRTIIDVSEGDVRHQAVLLLPAVIARNYNDG